MFRLAHPTRRILLLALCAALCVDGRSGWSLSARHQHKQVRQEIQELENLWRTATLAGDYMTMGKLLSDDFVGIAWNGQVSTKEMQIDRLRSRSFSMKQLDVSDEKIKVVGDVAIVTATANVQGTIEGTEMAGAYRYTRIYQRLPAGVWKVTNFEATRVNPDEPLRHGRHGEK